MHARFAEADLPSILDHHASQPGAGTHRATEDSSLTQGTAGWATLGRPRCEPVRDDGLDEGEVIA